MNAINIFRGYKQLENHFTNGFISLLRLSQFESPKFVSSFLQDELGLTTVGEIDTFRVLPAENGTADGELKGEECRIWLETKIKSGTLHDEQIRRHLEGDAHYSKEDDGRRKGLNNQTEMLRRLVLLTPDDSGSKYIQHYLSIDSKVIHLSWKRVYKFLQRSLAGMSQGVFSELVRQFLERIRGMVFQQDYAGVVLKIQFGGKAEVYEDRYLEDMKLGLWTRWNTPKQYKRLDGTGRKLILYDTNRRAITAEVEIKTVTKTDTKSDFPWTNEFVPETLHILDFPIPLSAIEMVKGFEEFGSNRSAVRNVTHEQYVMLMKEQPNKTPDSPDYLSTDPANP